MRNSFLRYEYYEKLTISMKTHFRYVSLVTVLLILRSTSQIPICFADRNLLTLESLSHGLCSKCTDLIEKSCTCLLSTNRTCSISAHPVFSQAFVNFSQFNLDFHEFRNLHNLNSSFAHRPSILNDSRKLCIYSDFQFIFTRYWILMSFS